ncbi:hypothetical protein B0T14DRAFT_570314 [Immersiella caudata]|uniref:Uncharacterized protein n=1 Tax=Immersiella caudata TaxID=314043 RepID=A0AA40BUT1_9PEZI|nr:hypothetical protein B0T14DRAFT_570314 [Immersiella caudata]
MRHTTGLFGEGQYIPPESPKELEEAVHAHKVKLRLACLLTLVILSVVFLLNVDLLD